VAAVIGLMAGFWASQGVFRLRPDDARVGGFLALATGIAAAMIGLIVVQNTIGIPSLAFDDPNAVDNQMRFVLISLALVAFGILVGWVSRRTVYQLEGRPEAARQYLTVAAAISAGALLFAFLRLLFGPTGYFSTMDGVGDDGKPDGFPNLTSLALADPLGFIILLGIGVLVALLIYRWASSGDNARLFPVWVGGLTTGIVAAAISAPIAAGVFGGVTGGGTDALVALFRTLGLNVFQSAFAQGLTSDPLDKTISYTVVFIILGALPITVRTMYSRGETTVAD
jgi:energy-coupling factor transport system substrate-specific component